MGWMRWKEEGWRLALLVGEEAFFRFEAIAPHLLSSLDDWLFLDT